MPRVSIISSICYTARSETWCRAISQDVYLLRCLGHSETYKLWYGQTVFPPWRIDMNPSISQQIDRLPFWFLLGCWFTFRLAWDYSVRICSNKTLVLNLLFLKHKESSALRKYERLQAAIRYILNLAWSFLVSSYLISKLIRGVLLC